MTEPRPLITDDEQEDFILSESEGWTAVGDPEERRRYWQALARRTLDEREDVSVGLSRRDLIRLKVKAEEIGVPYQSLISALIHRYVADPKGS